METKICTECNLEKEKTEKFFRLHRDKRKKNICYYYASKCRECESKIARKYQMDNYEEYRRKQDLYVEKSRNNIRLHIGRRMNHWKNRSCVFDLTIDYLVNLYNQQDGKCYYSGVQMIVGGKKSEGIQNVLSLDKIDPNQGYIKGNVVWCTYRVNTMKSNLNKDQFFMFIKTILLNHDFLDHSI